ncbi:hypothetical protein STEG23_004152, partial [Scotinomys teguina]
MHMCLSPEYACEKPSMDVCAWNPNDEEAVIGGSQKRVINETAWIPRRDATPWNGACSLTLLGG